MKDAAPISVFLIGDVVRAEFRGVLEALEQSARVTRFNSLAIAGESSLPPDLCVLLQISPGEYAASTLEALLARWPLTRFVAVVGPLGEGEPRSGKPWPGHGRVYWHAFASWWSEQLAHLANGELTAWQRPLTYRVEDLAQHVTPLTFAAPEGLIGVLADGSGRSSALLVDMLRSVGWNARLVSPPGQPLADRSQALLWDDDDPDGDWRREFVALRAAWPEAPIVVLRNFPRPEDRVFLGEASPKATTAVVAKPFELDSLLATLQRLIHPPKHRRD